MTFRPFAAMCLLVCLLGCSRADDPAVTAPPSTPTQSATVTATAAVSPSPQASPEMTVCTNQVSRYSVSYPTGWFTTQNNEQNRCRWFDPQRFEIHEASEAPLVAIDVKDEEGVSFRDVRRSFESSGSRLISISETTIAGRNAYEFEYELTEDRLYPKGTRTFGFLIDNSGDAFLVTTTKLPDSKAPYEQNKEFVRRSARTVAFL